MCSDNRTGGSAGKNASDDVTAAGVSGSRAGVPGGSAPLAIDIEDLRFSYAGADAPVLDGCDWRVPEGAFALLVGGTGSGKSTLLSLLKPEISPAGECVGMVRVLGETLEGMEPTLSAAQIGYVFQNPENQIVCETVWHEMAFGLENLGVPQDEMRRRVAETSYFFGLEDWIRCDTDTLSGGRKQLLSLAAVLALRPRLLLLDEPTSQLDPIAEKNFLHALFRANRELGCTVVVATHQPRPMLDYATCAFALEDGRVHEVADMSALGRREALLGDVAGSHRTFSRFVNDCAGAEGALEAPEGCVSAGFAADLHKTSSDMNKNAGNKGPRGRSAGRNRSQIGKMYGTPATTLKEGWFRYDRAAGWVLRGVDASFAAGAVHAVAGGNGCGKSTLLAVLAKTARLQRGRVVRAAKSCALLPQNPKALLVGETVLGELMEWAAVCGYGEDDARACLERLGLSGLEARHPYDLSGGQQQLLALGKLLLVNPELLLLDEPTKGLDLASRRTIARVLREHVDAGGTVIMATHDLDFAEQVADDVSLMFDGELACTEPADRFFADNMFFTP